MDFFRHITAPNRVTIVTDCKDLHALWMSGGESSSDVINKGLMKLSYNAIDVRHVSGDSLDADFFSRPLGQNFDLLQGQTV